MQTKRGLGRGIEALLPGTGSRTEEKGELYLPLDKLKANPDQPRKYFDQTALDELAMSVREHGVIEPVIVEETEDGFYIIVAGERRCRAAALAGLQEVPALVRNYSEEKRLEISIIENIQREGLNPVEEALAYKQLMDLAGYSQDEVAAKVGKSRPAVANSIRLLKLPEPVQDALRTGKITQGHARAILAVETAETQLALFTEIVDRTLTVREAESRAAEMNKSPLFTPKPKTPAVPKARDPHLASMEQRFIDRLGTKVRIDGDAASGSIRIDYYSQDDLDRLHEIIVPQ
ncbi:MAG: ParB/RepB/Spo0J family partition protein [Spirochaetaceae bacterium]|nr:ParB/RepB/Spo0J family partition protein [Spirochaetaceae bacterium]